MSVAIAQLLLGVVLLAAGVTQRRTGGTALMLIGGASMAIGGFALLAPGSALGYAALAVFAALLLALLTRLGKDNLRRHAGMFALVAASVACIALSSLLPRLSQGAEQMLMIGVWVFASLALVMGIVTMAKNVRVPGR